MIRDAIRQAVKEWLYANDANIGQGAIDELVDILLLSMLTCLRCGYQWYPRTPQLPKVCPNPRCKSPYWNTPRRRITAATEPSSTTHPE